MSEDGDIISCQQTIQNSPAGIIIVPSAKERARSLRRSRALRAFLMVAEKIGLRPLKNFDNRPKAVVLLNNKILKIKQDYSLF